MTSPLTWLFPDAARVGWFTTRVPNPPIVSAIGTAYLFRGNGAIFSPGFGRLSDRLRAAGVWTEDLRCVGDRWVCRHAASHSPRGPMVLIGHSRGGRRAVVAAAQMGSAVDLVVCVDVAFASPIPANVRRAVHLYRSGWRLYPAGPLASGAGGRIDNIDLDQPDAPFSGRGLHHLNITASPALHDWIVREVLALTAACRGCE